MDAPPEDAQEVDMPPSDYDYVYLDYSSSSLDECVGQE